MALGLPSRFGSISVTRVLLRDRLPKAICRSFCIVILARSTGLASKVIVLSLSGQKLVVVISSNSVILMALKSFSWYSLLFWWAMILFYELPERLCRGGEVVDRIKAALGRSEEWVDFELIYGFSSFMYRLDVLGTWWYALLGEDVSIVFYHPDFEFTFLAADRKIILI